MSATVEAEALLSNVKGKRRSGFSASFSQALRFSRRELRAGLGGFRIFLACLFLGVAAIAGVSSLSEAMLAGLNQNGQALLGGDVELRLNHRQTTAEEQAWITENSDRISRTAQLRTMARSVADPSQRRLVELKAVDDLYPLFGEFRSQTNRQTDGVLNADLQALIAPRNGVYGAIVDEGLLARLDLELGDMMALGELDFQVRGTVAWEPDRASRGFTLGPRVVVPLESLAATELEQPGSLIYYHYRLETAGQEDVGAWIESLNQAHPQAGWRIRSVRNATPGLSHFIERVALFMTLVGFTSLLVGGLGVANAVRAFLEEKRATIATLKCLGAPARVIFWTYLLQVLFLASLGVVGGLLIGGLVPLVVAPLLEARLNFSLAQGVFATALLEAALYGFLITLVFSLWPLARAQQIPAGALFRDVIQKRRVWPPARALVALAVAIAALLALVFLGAEDKGFALSFIVGALASLLVLRLAAWGLVAVVKRLPRPRRPDLRLALANLVRPGAPTGAVITSLGLGLTVLVAIALIEGNLRGQVIDKMPEEAPGFYFIDIQPHQVEAFDRLALDHPGVSSVKRVPMLRGRIAAVKGVAPENMVIPDEIDWVFRGDRGLTWSALPPDGMVLSEGAWWPEDYQGKPLVSLDAEVGVALNLHPGDELTINLLGRNIDVTIANLREIDWRGLSINFVMIFSPGLLETAPQTHIATVKIEEAQETALELAITDAFPNVSSVRVKDALEAIGQLLGTIATAVSGTAAITLTSGLLVLAGAVAAGHRRRIYDAVVLKVLGATRWDVTRAYLLEYGLLGFIASGIAALAGLLAAYLVMTQIMEASFLLLWPQILLTVLLSMLVTLAVGFLGTWRALSHKAAPLLRNE
ncbi:ABC transporter permease [Rhodovibrionaceae bacterium A322]